MNSYKTLKAQGLEDLMTRIVKKCAEGARLNFSITSTDGRAVALNIKCGNDELRISSSYSIEFAENEKQTGWLAKVTYNGKAREILDAHGNGYAPACVALAYGKDATREAVKERAVTKAKEYLAELQKRYQSLCSLYENELLDCFDVDCTKVKETSKGPQPIDDLGNNHDFELPF